jgi:hypothetical protein
MRDLTELDWNHEFKDKDQCGQRRAHGSAEECRCADPGGTECSGVVGTTICATSVAAVARAGRTVARLTSASRISTVKSAPPSGTLYTAATPAPAPHGGPTTLPWGLEIESTNVAFPTGLPAGTLFQPLFLYEMIWNAIGVVLIIFVLERRFTLRWGKALGFYLLWYGRAGHSWSPCDSTRRSSTSSDSRSTWTSLSWPPSPGSCSSSCRPDVTPGRETSIYLTPKKPPIDGLTAAAAPSGSHADVRPAVELPNGQMGDSRRDA